MGGDTGSNDSSNDSSGISEAEFAAAEASFDYGTNAQGQTVSGSYDSATGMTTQTFEGGTISYSPLSPDYSVTYDNGTTHGYYGTGGQGGVNYSNQNGGTAVGTADRGYEVGQAVGTIGRAVMTGGTSIVSDMAMHALGYGDYTAGGMLGNAMSGTMGFYDYDPVARANNMEAAQQEALSGGDGNGESQPKVKVKPKATTKLATQTEEEEDISQSQGLLSTSASRASAQEEGERRTRLGSGRSSLLYSPKSNTLGG